LLRSNEEAVLVDHDTLANWREASARIALDLALRGATTGGALRRAERRLGYPVIEAHPTVGPESAGTIPPGSVLEREFALTKIASAVPHASGHSARWLDLLIAHVRAEAPSVTPTGQFTL